MYVTSDFDYFYPNNPLPFQEGNGYMLEVLFLDSGKIPYPLVATQFLGGYGTEGYRVVNGKGFGFYYDKDALVKLYAIHLGLNINQLVGFEYTSRTKTIHLITAEIRRYVKEHM